MKTFQAVLVSIFVIFVFICLWPKSQHVEQSGNIINFDFNSLHMVGELGDSIDGEYYVVGAAVGNEPFLGVIPKRTAEKLNAQFGDFRHCANPGARKAQAATGTILIVSKNPLVTTAHIQLSDTVTRKSNLVVRLKGQKIKLLKYFWGEGENRKESTNYPNPAEFTFITELKIIEAR